MALQHFTLVVLIVRIGVEEGIPTIDLSLNVRLTISLRVGLTVSLNIGLSILHRGQLLLGMVQSTGQAGVPL